MGGKGLHVRSHFRQQHLGHPAIDARHRVQALDLIRKRARVLLDLVSSSAISSSC